MIVYQIIEQRGLGVVESPIKDYALIGEIYIDKQAAIQRAKDLYLNNTSKNDRESGWCPLHYYAKETKVN